jgi:CHAT domain-containing protein
VARAATVAPGTGATDPARYAAALSDVLWADSGGAHIDHSIAFLESTSRLAEKPAGILADLSGAYLVRAELRQTPGDLFRALDTATRAQEISPRNVVACFNRALALEYIGVDRAAAAAWDTCATIDGRSGWGLEAWRRAGERAAAAAIATPAPPSADAAAAEVETFVAVEPGAARVHGWEIVLGAWGSAVLREDSAAARRQLALAETIARALARRGGDRTLADAVDAIHAARRPEERQRLARGHVAYAQGTRIYREVDPRAAGPFVSEVLELHPRSAPLLGWSRRLEAMTLLAQGEYDTVETRFTSAGARTDTLRHPALAASYHQTRGTALLRIGRYQQARDAWATARRLFHRAGERENTAGTRYLEGDAEYLLDAPEAPATMHRAMMELRPFRRSVWLHNAFAVLGIELAERGLPHAALAVYDEGVGVARAAGHPIYEVEARLLRAQLLAAMGRQEEANADMAASEPAILRLPAGYRRDWSQVELHAARAFLLLRRDPRRAAAQMDSLLAAEGGARSEPRVLLGLLGRARARLAAGDAEAATADLDAATRMLSEQGAAVTTPRLRASILDAARETFDRLVMLRLAGGDTLGALRALERGRLSLAPGPAAPASIAGWTLPAGTAALDYAVVGDTLVAWAVTPGRVVLHRRAIDRAALLRTLEQLRVQMELRADETELRPLLAGLYRDLVQPLRAALPARARLAVVADGELADVPFAALLDAATGQYLAQSYTVVHASSLRDVRGSRGPRQTAGRPALFVADPAFDEVAYPTLSRLPGAAAEVQAVAGLYPDTLLLGGAQADTQAVARRLTRAAVFHFAGHAVFDDERPARSFLLLATRAGEPASERLTAAQLGALDLHGVELVVLSSCETLRSPRGRSGGFAGLSGALLGAGAGGVVGSPWKVEDGTVRQLMTDFHRHYRQTGDGAGALNAAQLLALDSRDPVLRSPSGWAAFRYAGS